MTQTKMLLKENLEMVKIKYMLMDYRKYCDAIFLTEENQKEVFERLHAVFPDESEFRIYSSILNLFPSLNAKSIIVTTLIRTNIERQKANINPAQTKIVYDEFIQIMRRNARIDRKSTRLNSSH